MKRCIMHYLYHPYPVNVFDHVLRSPEEHAKRVAGSGTEIVSVKTLIKKPPDALDRVISPLNCTERQVITFRLVSPSELTEAFRKAKIPPPEGLFFYQILPRYLVKERTVIRQYNVRFKKYEYVGYDTNKLEEFSGIPKQTLEYYRKEAGKVDFDYWKYVPEVLHRGTLNVINVPILKT